MVLDLNKYKETFLREARAYIETMNLALVEIEKNSYQKNSFQEIAHALHTLKSLMTTMSYQSSTHLCHMMEDLFEIVSANKFHLNKYVDVLFECFDHLSENLKLIENNQSELPDDTLIHKLENLIHGNENLTENSLIGLIDYPSAIEKSQSIEVKVERLDKFMHLTEELLITKMKFDALRSEIENPELSSAIGILGRLITDLQYHVMQARLTPIEFVFNRFVRMARDLAKQQNKEVNIQFESNDIELDRLLIDEIGESIAHLIRNAIDHGIESPQMRNRINKSTIGNIKLRANRLRENVIIEVSDDGAGLDLKALKEIAIKRQIIKPDVNITNINDIIFPGLSTTMSVTKVSGRGLGLSIVKRKIESIGGTIRIESMPNSGTTFYLEIPLTLAIIKTLFVRVSGELYAIPIEFIERLLVVAQNDIKGIFGGEAIIFEGRDIPVIRLSILFAKDTVRQAKQPLVIIHKGKTRLALAVDSLISTQEVVIKPLNRAIKDNKYVSGVTLVGSGHMVLILDIVHLMQISKKIEMEEIISFSNKNQIVI